MLSSTVYRGLTCGLAGPGLDRMAVVPWLQERWDARAAKTKKGAAPSTLWKAFAWDLETGLPVGWTEETKLQAFKLIAKGRAPADAAAASLSVGTVR
jgi:hypothetical protein